MADKSDATIDQVSYLLVRGLERRQVTVRHGRVEVTGFDPRILRQVIHNLGTLCEMSVFGHNVYTKFFYSWYYRY